MRRKKHERETTAEKPHTLVESAKAFLSIGDHVKRWYDVNLCEWHDHVCKAGQLADELARRLRDGSLAAPPIAPDEDGRETALATDVAEEKARILAALDASVAHLAFVIDQLQPLLDWAEVRPARGRGAPPNNIEAMFVESLNWRAEMEQSPPGHLVEIDLATGKRVLHPHAGRPAGTPPSLAQIQNAIDEVNGRYRELGTLSKNIKRRTK
jgi:hypothetical protein